MAAVRGAAVAPATPIAALVLAGMNDVINSQSYTQAAYESHPDRVVVSNGRHGAVL